MLDAEHGLSCIRQDDTLTSLPILSCCSRQIGCPGEELTFRFEADAFGLTNTPHFANPDANITDSNFGKVTGEAQGANASLGGSGGERLWYLGGKFVF